MQLSQIEWIVTLWFTIAVLLFDVVVIARRPHEPTMRECAIALAFYVGFAVLFGLWVSFFHFGQYGLEFFAGWLTEYNLSVDDLFIFLIIMANFKVPKMYRSKHYCLAWCSRWCSAAFSLRSARWPSSSSRGSSPSSVHFSSTRPSIWLATPNMMMTRTTWWSGSLGPT